MRCWPHSQQPTIEAGLRRYYVEMVKRMYIEPNRFVFQSIATPFATPNQATAPTTTPQLQAAAADALRALQQHVTSTKTPHEYGRVRVRDPTELSPALIDQLHELVARLTVD